MEPKRFDHINKLFADRSVSRREAMSATAGAATAMAAMPHFGLAQQASPKATPVASPAAGETAKTTFLFVRSFQSGTT